MSPAGRRGPGGPRRRPRRPRAGPGPARYLAPALFLLAVTVAVLLIRSGLRGGGDGGTTTTTVATSTSASTTSTHASTTTAAPGTKQFYTVQSGDTFGSIAAKTGTTVALLEQLNPGVSTNSLQVGQKIRVK